MESTSRETDLDADRGKQDDLKHSAVRREGDNDSDTYKELFAEPKNPPPMVFSPQLDLVWIVLIGLAAGTRMLNLHIPHYVVFDEVHFGRFTSYFMKGKFFFDVHPPLSKLLFALTGYLIGYDGSFNFDEIGQDLGAMVDAVWYLRLVPAVFSTLLVPCIYEILTELGCSYWAAGFGALLVTFENMLVVQSRLILLDSPLLFFVAASLCSYIKFRRQQHNAFGVWWWTYLLCLGLSLTGALSTKYNGLLTVLLVGGFTAYDLWALLGDVKISAKSLSFHVVARVACLLVLPIGLYIAQFYVLFAVLPNSGPHDDMMTSEFQRTLRGGLATITEHQAAEVAYGSQITLRNMHGKQCWLHSHAHLYPIKYDDGRGSSAQQQVTCYGFKDVNNWWIVKAPDRDSLMVDFPPRPVKNGDIIHLVHGTTGRGLNGHDVAAPLHPHLMEVSGYIDHNVSMDPQFGWKVEILNADEDGTWKTIGSHIRFVHVNTSSSLRVSGGLLPEWGFHQYEVALDRQISTQESIWNVEEHNQNISYPKDMSKEEIKRILSEASTRKKSDVMWMPFHRKFFELQTRMLRINREIQQEHTFSSRPMEWLFMKRGVAYWLDKTTNAQIFCIGNPAVWWTATLAVAGCSVLFVIYLLRRRRAIYDLYGPRWRLFSFTILLLVGGYLLHFLPFFPMERTLFVHHYLPALLFKILLIPVLADHIHSHLLCEFPVIQRLFVLVCIVYLFLVVVVFKYFSPLTYGSPALSGIEVARRKWLTTWDFLSHPNT